LGAELAPAPAKQPGGHRESWTLYSRVIMATAWMNFGGDPRRGRDGDNRPIRPVFLHNRHLLHPKPLIAIVGL